MKKFLRLLPILLIFVCSFSTIFAAIDTTMPDGSGSIPTVETAANTIWGTVLLIIRILAFAALIFAGLRYMFASADTKADIKKQTVVLVIGAAIVFAAEPIVSFVAATANAIFK